MRRTLCFSSYKNHILKIKLRWRLGLAKEKRGHFLYRLFCPKGVCVLSQCIVYWIHFHNIYTFTYQKHYFIHFCSLFLKFSKACSVSLSPILLQSKKLLHVSNWHCLKKWFQRVTVTLVVYIPLSIFTNMNATWTSPTCSSHSSNVTMITMTYW